jgi:fido (protein-threonine AMPylation protein)
MTNLFGADEDATPLTPQERDRLIPTHVTLRSELNELEQQNIADADRWAFSRKRNILDEAFLRGLHRRMFNRVWRWAGEYRTTERNLGVPPFRIQPDLRQTIGDGQYWINHQTYSADELAGALPPSIGFCASISQRQRTLVAARGGFANRRTGWPALHMGPRQSPGCQ